MRTIQILAVMILMLASQVLSATTEPTRSTAMYQEGTILKVWAVNGLNMRDGPGKDFPISRKLHYGDEVKITDPFIGDFPMSIKVIDKKGKKNDFELKGNWVRVMLDDVEGYVFDGYLSRLPVINIKKGKEGEHNSWFPESLSDYVERTIGSKINAVQKVRKGYINTTIEANKWISLYKSEGDCNESRITLEDMTFGEAYLFFNVLHRFEEKIKLYQTTNINIYNCRARIILEKYLLKTKEATLRERHGKFYIYEGGCC